MQRAHRTSRRRGLVILAAALAVTLVAAGCGDDEPAGADSKEIIVFSRTSSDTYQAAWQRGMVKTATDNGYTVTFFENNADQNEQNNQVSQQIGGGAEPAAFAWMPADASAGAATLKRLSETGIPVFQVNQLPPAGTEDYVVAYAGVNDVINGRTSGELIAEARDEMIADGRISASDPTRLAIIKFHPEFAASIDRLAGMRSVIGADIDAGVYEIVGEAEDAVDAATGFDAASSIMSRLQETGVDIVYAQNDASAAGVIQALIEGGFTPGDDVEVIGGNCRDDVSDLTSGLQFGTGLQGAELEGEFSMQMIINYLNNREVAAGEYEAPATADGYPDWPDTISKYNFIPNPPVKGDEVDGYRLWGQSMVAWCSY